MLINAIALEEDWLLELRRIEREAFERAVRNIAIKQRGDAYVEVARGLVDMACVADPVRGSSE